VVVLQTIVLVMVGTVGYALGPYYQALVITAALQTILVLLLSVRPHASAAAGVVSSRSLWLLSATAFSALTFLPYRNIRCAPLPSLHVLTLPWLTNLAAGGWCGKGQLQESAGGSLQHHGPVKHVAA
jgi:hypothetical protein